MATSVALEDADPTTVEAPHLGAHAHSAPEIRLDDYLLSDEECAALDAWDQVIGEATDGQLSDLELARRLSAVAEKAQGSAKEAK